jgi:hypothetical protein
MITLSKYKSSANIGRVVSHLIKRERGRVDSHRQIGFTCGFGFYPFRGRVCVHLAAVNVSG